jgi:hypothetical protein
LAYCPYLSIMLFTASPSGCPFETSVYSALRLCTLLFLPGRSVLSFHHLCRSFNFGISNLSEERFLIYNSLWSFDFSELLLKTQPTTSTFYWISLSCKHSMKTFKITSEEGILNGNCFFQSNYRGCFLTVDLLERNSYKSMITRWSNPPWFSLRNETEITLQLVNWHSTVAEQNLWLQLTL